MTTQAQKKPFKAKKKPFSPIFEQKLVFFGAGGPETLVISMKRDATHACLSLAASKWVGGPAGDHPGSKNTVLGRWCATNDQMKQAQEETLHRATC